MEAENLQDENKKDESKEVAETIEENKEYNARWCPNPGVLDIDMAR